MRVAHWPVKAAMVLSTVIITVVPQAASASMVNICTTFTGCLSVNGLLGSAGYNLVYTSSFWNMLAGHNCTNYIAYRLTHGRLVARPPGTSDASTWGTAATAAGITVDDTPTVGAVAWWKAWATPAGAKGHVAYVEAVHADGSFDVSEDNQGGTFDWRTFSPGVGWPSGFIHYPESDGSPDGEFTSIAAPDAGQVDLWGTASDPDALDAPVNYLLTLGGPRTDASAEQVRFATSYFNFHQIRTVATRGTVTAYLYALNTVGSAGHDVLLGTHSVTVRGGSLTSAKLKSAKVSHKTAPKITVVVSPGAASGKIVVKKGSTTLKTYSLTASNHGKVTLTLPKQSKGTKKLKAYYQGSSVYAPSSSPTISLKVT